jgi:hypothetical protein
MLFLQAMCIKTPESDDTIDISSITNLKIEVKFGAAYGRFPTQPYIKKIEEIMENARKK